MHMHAFVGPAFIYSQYFSPPLLPTQLLGDAGGRAKVGARIWPSRDTTAEAQHSDLLPRGRQEVLQEGWGLRRGWPALCVEAETGVRKHREIQGRFTSPFRRDARGP